MIMNILIILYVMLQLFDTCATMYIVYGGHGVEVNPFMISVVESGSLTFVITKVLVTAATAFIFWACQDLKYSTHFVCFVILIYLREAVNQYQIISNSF